MLSVTEESRGRHNPELHRYSGVAQKRGDKLIAKVPAPVGARVAFFEASLRLLCGALAIAVLLPSQRAAAAVLLDENFDELSSGADLTSVGQFQAVAGNVDIAGPTYFPYLCAGPTSGSCVDLNGGSQGTLQSVSAVTLQPGVNYYLSFDLIGS